MATIATNVVIKLCSVSLWTPGCLGAVCRKPGGELEEVLGRIWTATAALSEVGSGIWVQESEGWCSFLLDSLNVKVPSHPPSSAPPACPPRGMCDHCWRVGEATLRRTAVGSAGKESPAVTPPGAQGFEQTNSVFALKLLVIQRHLGTCKFRVNQSKWFLKPASQWGHIL